MLTVAQAIKSVMPWLPKETPEALCNACKCEPIDPDWPIQSPLDALKYLAAWEMYEAAQERGDGLHSADEIAHRITHSHHFEYQDLQTYGVADVYKKSLATKYVSIGWFLAGRYNQDNFLIEEFNRLGWPRFAMLDFGAAPWIQTLFYANKGFDVVAVNQTRDSDCHRFSRFLAEVNGYAEIAPSLWAAYKTKSVIREFASDENWHDGFYDVVYAVDVLEHIPPNPDGSLGWILVAEKMLAALKPGGMCYMSAPFEKAEGVARPVTTHPVHYTSPISIEDWLRSQGMIYKSWWVKPGAGG